VQLIAARPALIAGRQGARSGNFPTAPTPHHWGSPPPPGTWPARPAAMASLISGSCPHRLGKPSTYSSKGLHGLASRSAHLWRMCS
jgi:hypothetical protein